MRFLFLFVLVISSTGVASQDTASGKIFLGGFTFLKENYLSTQINLQQISNEIQITLNPLEPYKDCIKEFEIGVFDFSTTLWFSNDTLIQYKVPIKKPCSENSAKLYKLEVIYISNTEKIKSVRLSPYRSKASAYFSTEF